METDHGVKEEAADSPAQLVIKLETPWHADEDSPDQPPAVYSTEQPMSDNTSLLSLDSKHPCYLCPAAFVLVSSLELHLASVHGEQLHVVLPGSSIPGRCDAGHCSKEVDSHGKTTTTKKVDDSDAGDKDRRKWKKHHVCDICRTPFLTPNELKRHKLTHSDHKPFVCDVCNKSFTQAGNLKKHKRVHKVERPFKCPHCDSAFKESSHLQHHIKSVHDAARPHVCDVCGAAFSLTGDLKVHRRVHTGEKPFVCSDCGKGFINSSNLKKHRLTHTGEKPHVCSDCGKGFAQSSHLANHRLTHTGQKPHSCPHCPAAFRYAQDLKKHVQRKHQ